MPIGTASDFDPGNDRRDALDAAVSKALRRRHLRRPQSAPAASPDTDLLPDELLLKYIDGALDAKAHAEVESRLLLDPWGREAVAVLKAAMAELQQEPTPVTSAGPPRYVFLVSGSSLQFLRGTNFPPPLPSKTSPEQEFGFQLAAEPLRGPAGLRLRASAGQLSLDLAFAGPAGAWPSQVSICRDGRVEHVAPVDGQGGARLERLSSCARHEVRLHFGATESTLALIEIRTA